MKKKICLYAVLCVFGILISGCSGKPEEVSQEVYDLGVETCDTLDDYVQGKMNQDTCQEALEKIADRAKQLDENEEKSEKDNLILTYIRLSPMDVSTVFVSEGETYKADETLEKLKKELNI